MRDARYARLMALFRFVFDGLPADFPLHFDLDSKRLPPKKVLAPRLLRAIEGALVKIKAVQGVTAAYSGDYKHKNEMFRVVWALSYCWAELNPLLDELARDVSAKPVQSSLDPAGVLKIFLARLDAFPQQAGAMPPYLIRLFGECFPDQTVDRLWDPASHLRTMPSAPPLAPDTAPAVPLPPMVLIPSDEATLLAAELQEYATRRLTNAYGLKRNHIEQAGQLAQGLRDGGITIEALRECVPQLLDGADREGGFYQILSPLRPDLQKPAAALQKRTAGVFGFFWRGRNAAPPQQPAPAAAAAASMALSGGGQQ